MMMTAKHPPPKDTTSLMVTARPSSSLSSKERCLPNLSTRRQYATSVVVDGGSNDKYIVLIGGENNDSHRTTTAELLEWNTLRRWYPLPHALFMSRKGCAAVSMRSSSTTNNDSVYVLGGSGHANETIDNDIDPTMTAIEEWTFGTPSWRPVQGRLLTPRSHAAAVVFNHQIVLMGGCDHTGTPLASVEQMRIDSSTTSSKLVDHSFLPPLSCPRCSPCAVSIGANDDADSVFYIMGGYDHSTNDTKSSQKVWHASGEVFLNGSWSSMPRMVVAVHHPTAVALQDDQYLLVHGTTTTTTNDDTISNAVVVWQLYHVQRREWKVLSSSIIPSMHSSSPLYLPGTQLQVIGSRLVVMGGGVPVAEPSTTTDAPDPQAPLPPPSNNIATVGSRRCVQIPLSSLDDLWTDNTQAEQQGDFSESQTTMTTATDILSPPPPVREIVPVATKQEISPKGEDSGQEGAPTGIALIAAGVADLSPLQSPSFSMHSTTRMQLLRQQQHPPPLEQHQEETITSPSSRQSSRNTKSSGNNNNNHHPPLSHKSSSNTSSKRQNRTSGGGTSQRDESAEGGSHSHNNNSAGTPTASTTRNKVIDFATTDQFGSQVSYTGYLGATDQLPQGKGRMTWFETGDRYIGSFEQGARQGRGRMVYSNGDAFEGWFDADTRQGNGIYRYHDGRRYIGRYQDDLAEDDQGQMVWTDGTTYVGQFRKAKRTGKGKLSFAKSNVTYEGDFASGKYHGYGSCTFADGSVYVGDWRKGKAHGKGTLTNAEGRTIHDGRWANDSPLY